uniref:Uncharacterized protein n=1 Tax=Caenorhabditis japonica TaxID=281687 RepID=A0A8R1EC64_CAEJA
MSNQVSPEDEPLLEQRTQSLSLADIPSDTTQEFVEGISNNPQSAEPPKNATADFVEDEEVGNESRRDSRVSTPMLDVDEDFERKQKRKQRKRKGRKSKSKLKMKTKTKKTGKPKEALVWKNVIVTKKTRQKKYKEIGKTILDDGVFFDYTRGAGCKRRGADSATALPRDAPAARGLRRQK